MSDLQEGERLAEQAQAQARSPIEWDESGEAAEAVGFFDWLWSQTYQRHQVDGECRWIVDPYDNPWTTYSPAEPGGIREDLRNLESRYPLAAQQFVEKTRRFWNLSSVTPSEHPKHFPAGDFDLEELCRRTKRSPSLLLPGIGPAEIVDAFLAVFDGLLAQCRSPFPSVRLADDVSLERLAEFLLTPNVLRLTFTSFEPIGATDGEPATSMCLELDAVTPRLHAYPIKAQEAKELRAGYGEIFVKDLAGFKRFAQRRPVQRILGRSR